MLDLRGITAEAVHDAPGTTTHRWLALVGCGIRGASQITVEGLRSVQAASCVMSISIDPRDLEFIYAALNVETSTALDDEYVDGSIDVDNYDRILVRVMDAMHDHPTVCLLTYGHPRLGVSLTSGLQKRCATSGVDFRVVAAPSSFDTMINDLKRDPLERGTMLIDANRLLLFGFRIDPTLDCFIYHLCSVGVARTHVSDPSRENQLELLRNRLLEFYEPGHEVVLVDSAATEQRESRQLRGTVGDLLSLLHRLTFASTLFIPAALPRSVDRDFLALLRRRGAH